MTRARIWDARYELAEPELIRALQLRKVRNLLNYAWATNVFYRERFRAAGVTPDAIGSLEDFAARVPTIAKPDFVADQAEHPPYGSRHAHAVSLREPLFVYTTSGTSGQGQEVHLQTAAEWEVSTGQVYPYLFRWAGLDRGDALMLAMPVTMLGGGRMEYHAGLAYGLTVHAIGNYDAQRKIELFPRFAPQAILANSSYLGRLGALVADRPAQARAGGSMKAVLGGGEASSLAWLERISDQWSAPVFDRYGSSQSGNDHMFSCDHGIGQSGEPGVLHNIDPYMLAEVIDPDTGRHVGDGELGELVITSLYRLDSPVIRCRVGDRAIYRGPGSCRCRRPFPGVEAASTGRVDDMLKLKGINVWPQAVDEVLFKHPLVDEYQVVVSSTDQGGDLVTARIVASQTSASSNLKTSERHLREMLHARIGIHFEVEFVDASALAADQWKAKRWLDQRVHAV